MALTNRDRVGQALDLLAEPLDAFIAPVVQHKLPPGHDWTYLLMDKDESKGISGKTYSLTDPSLGLRALTETLGPGGWRPFTGLLTRVHESFASELRDARNRWAHGEAFTSDDAYRVLDTAERLLQAINAPAAAAKVGQLRQDLRRLNVERDDSKVLKALVTGSESQGLRPWREVLPPHDDVATGNFQASEFAADLFKVASGESTASDYADPKEFFARTYLTDGLRDLVTRAVRRLKGDQNASPVVNLQTNFGGGKTHSMLALWHLASGLAIDDFPQEWQELLSTAGIGEKPLKTQRVALVGNHIAPSGEVKDDGTKVNTLWGELAWQLGGAEAYELVAEADRTSTTPGSALHELLALYQPAVILVDEWVAYARQLYGRDDLAGGTFDTQFTFAQQLTEAVKATPGVLLAISIPASYDANKDASPAGSAEEVGGEHGLEALSRLQNVVRRVADQWRPASSVESYHIVRRRLFKTPDAEAMASILATTKAFVEMYRTNPNEFPKEARDVDYEQRIRQTYPIHPELFERLYNDWSTLERFQRTRGVLRLMNAVIHALWVGGDQSPLIMPGSITLAADSVNTELTQYLQDSWKAVIDADVDGPNSEPARIDQSNPLFGARAVVRRLARTVFFGAAPTLGAAHKGLETQRVFLGTAMPGDVIGNFHSALRQLGDRATYFYSGGGKYWYDLQANISRRAKDQAERLHPEDVWAEIVSRLQVLSRDRGPFAAVHVGPMESGDIPDEDRVRLVIVHPSLTHTKSAGVSSPAGEFALNATNHRGSGLRTNRNMLVFLAADSKRMEELDAAVRDYLGWKEVLDKADDLDLTQNQKNQATERLASANATAGSRLEGAYHWILNPVQPKGDEPLTVVETKAEGSDWLASRVARRLSSDGTLATQQSMTVVRHTLNSLPALWQSGHVRVGDLWRNYATYPYLPRLTNIDVLIAGVTHAPLLWQADGFALADGYDDATGRYSGLWTPDDRGQPLVGSQTLIVRPQAAAEQRLSETSAPDVSPPVPSVVSDGDGPRVPPVVTPAKPQKTRFFGAKTLNSTRYALDFKAINDEVLSHLAATEGVHLTVRVEIEAVASAGFDDARVRTVSENANTLKFEQSGFEEG